MCRGTISMTRARRCQSPFMRTTPVMMMMMTTTTTSRCTILLFQFDSLITITIQLSCSMKEPANAHAYMGAFPRPAGS
jgi:hypothetical protein